MTATIKREAAQKSAQKPVEKSAQESGQDRALKLRRLSDTQADFNAALDALTAYEPDEDAGIERAVTGILANVRKRGDAALLEYTERFDRVKVASAAELELPQAALQQALAGLDPTMRTALETAAQRIRSFHERQLGESWRFTEADGTVLGQEVRALDRVGIYVPGGKAAYPSSVLMNAVPAKVAGVREIIMVVPTPGGQRNPLVLAAAALAGVDRVFTVGGAQAIAALAHGTQTVPKVDKIVGPGNAYVAAAKRRVFGTVGIDMIAGPSEIVVIADGSVDPDWVAMDLFSQAEHDEMAQAILISPDRAYLDRVEASLNKQLAGMPRREVIRASLEGRGALIQVASLEAACELSNNLAPEHLELSMTDAEKWIPHIRNAGAIFVGPRSSEALGDYCAGPNHVLPTSRTARFSSPLGVYDFQKRSSIINISPAGAQTLGRITSTLAHGEGLDAHARSAEYRLGGKKN